MVSIFTFVHIFTLIPTAILYIAIGTLAPKGPSRIDTIRIGRTSSKVFVTFVYVFTFKPIPTIPAKTDAHVSFATNICTYGFCVTDIAIRVTFVFYHGYLIASAR